MTTALCTFEKNGTKYTLGTEDSFIVATPEVGKIVYEVRAFYVNRSTPIIFVTGAQRAAAESYVADLATAIGLTELVSKSGPSGQTYYDYADPALAGVLTNTYSGLVVTGAVLTGIDHDDDGGRAFGITFTFEKPITPTSVTNSSNKPTFDPAGATPVFALGTSDGVVIVDPTELEVLYTVRVALNEPTRAIAETAFRSLWDQLSPQPLEEIDVDGKPSLVARNGAVRGTLTNPLTGLTVSDVYPVEMSQEDDGGMSVSATIVFSKPRHAAPLNTSDARVPKYKTYPLGNQAGTIVQRVESPSFIRYLVTSIFIGANAHVLADAVCNSVGWETVFVHEIPRGGVGSRGVVKSPLGTPGTLTHSSLPADVPDLYVEQVAVDLRRQDFAEISITLVKGR